MEEILTVRLPKGTRRRLERRARAQKLTLSQYVRKALDTEQFLDVFEAARAKASPQARTQGIYTDEDVFARIS
jgi:predicted transcriptional regulator